MERDLGRELEWVAANHYDTTYPHTHIVLRGGARGEEWYMARSYVEHGIRDRAAALLTRMVGQQTQESLRSQIDHTYTQERLVLNGMLRGGPDPDVWHLYRHRQASQAQQAEHAAFSVSRSQGAEALRAELTALHQRTQALQMHQGPWQHSQKR
jgi:type IV secretory pathway VirD2 relaxase